MGFICLTPFTDFLHHTTLAQKKQAVPPVSPFFVKNIQISVYFILKMGITA